MECNAHGTSTLGVNSAIHVQNVEHWKGKNLASSTLTRWSRHVTHGRSRWWLVPLTCWWWRGNLISLAFFPKTHKPNLTMKSNQTMFQIKERSTKYLASIPQNYQGHEDGEWLRHCPRPTTSRKHEQTQ